MLKDKKPLKPGHVRLTSRNRKVNIKGWIDETNPRLTGGWGGWEVTERPRQVGVTTWKGVEPFTLEFGMILNGDRVQSDHGFESVEPDIRELVSAARGDSAQYPNLMTIDGIKSLPVDRWVIESMEFGDAIRRATDFHRIRQQITFTMREYVPPAYEPTNKKALNRALGRTVTVKVKKNDTAAIIAKRRGCKWTDLRKMNPGVVHTANRKLQVGIKIRVPASENKRHKRKSKD